VAREHIIMARFWLISYVFSIENSLAGVHEIVACLTDKV